MMREGNLPSREAFLQIPHRLQQARIHTFEIQQAANQDNGDQREVGNHPPTQRLNRPNGSLDLGVFVYTLHDDITQFAGILAAFVLVLLLIFIQMLWNSLDSKQ